MLHSSPMMRVMSENERRILALVVEQGPLTKGELASKGQMAWATVVKYVSRLQKENILTRAGTAPREAQLGKNSYLFELSESAPKFVGIDIEYRITRVAIVNLRREILWQATMPTPELSDDEGLVAFLETEVFSRVTGSEIVSSTRKGSPFGEIAGVGIGMPRWLLPFGGDVFTTLGHELSSRLDIPVRVENNIRAYTLYKEPTVLESNYLVVGVRNGIGAGLVIDGTLFRGEQGLAGEIGHITVDENGAVCRCGKRGCLETVVNQYTLFDSYCATVERSPVEDAVAVEEALPELFARAANDDSDALAVLSSAAQPLGRALATLLLVLNVKTLYLVGHFGEHGAVWLDELRQVIRRNVDPRLSFELNYRQLEEKGYLLGSAMLVIREYLDYSVLNA